MFRKRIFLIGAGLLAFFALGGVTVLVFLSYKIRNIKEPLLAELQSHIDGQIRIGEAKVVMFPTGIDLKDVTLFAPGETEASASVKKAEIRFSLIPLLRKKFQTRLVVVEPKVFYRKSKDGGSNMEKIFRPLMGPDAGVAAKGGPKAETITPLDRLWWRRLAVDKLAIRDAVFVASTEGRTESSEWSHVNVEADQIRFESAERPAKVKVSFQLPRVSAEPLEATTKMLFDEAKQTMALQDGTFSWGAVRAGFKGEATLPGDKQKDALLAVAFQSEPIDLKKFGKSLKEPLPLSGTLTMTGTVAGSLFAPVTTVQLQSPALGAAGKTLANFKADLVKKEAPIEVTNASFGIYGGSVQIKGQLLPGETWGGQFRVALRSLSLAAASGNAGNPARLNGDLQIASKNLANPGALSGGGDVTVGPVPLPVIDMKSKIQVAEILTSGTSAGKMVNVGMLSSSQNVIGSSIPQIRAKVKIAGNNITLAPFSMGNEHFNASGSGTIFQQKSIQASGTFTLNGATTAQLFPDRNFRSVVTEGKGVVSFPFSASGPLDNPNISIDSSRLKAAAAKATALGLANMLAGGVDPNQMINSALKKTPLGDANNPLGQILGTSQPRPSQATASAASKKTGSTSQKTQPAPKRNNRSTSGNKMVDQLLFGR